MTMNKPLRISAVCLALLSGISLTGPAAPRPAEAGTQAPIVSFRPDLSIGVEDGDENLMFGSVSRVDVDGKGNIHVLDYKFRKIGVFDEDGRFLRTIVVPQGQGPREATNLSGIAVTPDGTLFVNDMRKVIVFGPDGQFLRSFLVDFMITSVGCPGTEDVVAIGSHGGKILHVFDKEGKLLASFGDPFPVPKEFGDMKEMPMFQAPMVFNCAKDGRIYVLDPHKYEISVFKDRRLDGILKGKSDLFEPVRSTPANTAGRRGFISKAADIVRAGGLTFALLSNPVPEAPKRAEIFEGGRQIGAVDLPGRPFCVDAQGRVYVAETDPFPRVVRYAVHRK